VLAVSHTEELDMTFTILFYECAARARREVVDRIERQGVHEGGNLKHRVNREH